MAKGALCGSAAPWLLGRAALLASRLLPLVNWKPNDRFARSSHFQHGAFVRQSVFSLCQGYEDLNDHDRLRDNLALQTALDRDPPAASSHMLCRLENRADRAAAVATQTDKSVR
ncbi:transposase [Cupriavidus alkaliphilus]|uniref:transposase n=1 Tax=Cupriavidus alkaliphilus TaxID=942866 RepID=UPI00339D45A8